MLPGKRQRSDSPGDDVRGRTRRIQLGQGVLEFSLAIPIVIMLFVGIVDFGRVLMIRNEITNAARLGARTAVMGDASQTAVNTQVEDYFRKVGLDPSSATVTINGVSAKTGGTATVAVSYPVTSLAAKLCLTDYQFQLHSTSSMPHE